MLSQTSKPYNLEYIADTQHGYSRLVLFRILFRMFYPFVNTTISSCMVSFIFTGITLRTTVMVMAQTERSPPSHFQSWPGASLGYKNLENIPTWIPDLARLRLLAFPHYCNPRRGVLWKYTILLPDTFHANPPTVVVLALCMDVANHDSSAIPEVHVATSRSLDPLQEKW